jgi:hypothetical protein
MGVASSRMHGPELAQHTVRFFPDTRMPTTARLQDPAATHAVLHAIKTQAGAVKSTPAADCVKAGKAAAQRDHVFWYCRPVRAVRTHLSHHLPQGAQLQPHSAPVADAGSLDSNPSRPQAYVGAAVWQRRAAWQRAGCSSPLSRHPAWPHNQQQCA